MAVMMRFRNDDVTWRACVRCPAIWLGAGRCSVCGSPGEPIAADIDPEPVTMEISADAGSRLPN